jgi:TP901 family phage tail tape measure protein
MADVQSNIKVSIDTTEALASIKNLQRQISAFHTSMAKSGAAANAVTAQMQQNLINSINATGKFSAQMRTIKTTTESFTSSLEKNKFSLGEYFRYAGGASKTFGKLFKTEFDTINKVARENVKDLQTQYIKMGRDANGAMRSIAVRPLSLDMNNLATKTMIASEKQAILNQLLKQGSTNLLNFGKNTQWAGRQLMVGFTIPLMAVGAAASKTFMDMETQAIRFKKVYGDLFTSTKESTAALEEIKALGKEFTKYGIAVKDTVGLAAEAAAAGFKGVDLQRQTAAATKLSILGQVESQKALETTIALQNAFSMSSQDLATNIDFLNAVENQTVLSLDDMSTAIPKAAPVIQQLGGDVKDLAFFMTAMKEGGINASEGANALKSGLASMINPTGKAAAMLDSLGINIKKIVVDNKGDLKKTVIDFATALNQLDPLNRAQAIEQMFGKFQFARLSTLFANVTKEGTQASRVLDLAGSSIQELAALSEKELGMTSQSAMNKFKASVENLKLSLVPLGEEFLKVVTPIAEFVTKILDKFNNLGDGTKKVIVTLTAIVAGLGPVLLMTFGLLANGLANIIKGFTFLKSIFNKTGKSSATLGTEVKYMTLEQRNAAAVAASLDQVHRNLAQTFSVEAASVDALTRAYYRAVAAQAQLMPTRVPFTRAPVTKRANGKPAVVGGTGNKDTELSLLMPGETVIPTKMSKKYGGLINGMIADNIPGYSVGKPGAKTVASHIEGFTPAQLSTTLSDPIMKRVLSVLPDVDVSIQRLSTTADGMVTVSRTIETSLRSLSSSLLENNIEDVTAIGTGEFAGTTTKTSAERNFMLNSAGIAGEPITFEQAQEASKKAQAYIDKPSKNETDNTRAQKEQAKILVQEQLDLEKSLVGLSQQEVEAKKADFTKIKSTQALEYTLMQKGLSAEEASTLAKQKIAEAEKATLQLVKEAKTDLEKRKIKEAAYKATLLKEMGAVTGYDTKNTKTDVFNKTQLNAVPRDMAKGQVQFGTPYKPGQEVPKDAAVFGSGKSFMGLSGKRVKRNQSAVVDESVRDDYYDDRGKIKSLFKRGSKDGTEYTKGVKASTKDPYEASLDRTSPHRLAARHGKEDGVAYQTAKEKAIKEKETQSGKKRRVATRPQGAAPIGPDMPQGSTLLPMVGMSEKEKKKLKNQRARQAKYANIKKVGSKFGGVQGSVGLMGANMALSAAPDFAGKNIIQSTMTGASMGMLFGPWGAAAGAAIGLVSSAISTLIEKQRIQKAMTEAAFKSSADIAAYFGNEIVNVDTSISNFGVSLGIVGGSLENIGKAFGYSTDELARFNEMVSQLPEGNPLRDLITGLTEESSPEKINKIAQAFVTTQVALGQIKPDQAQKTFDLILASSGKVAMVGSNFMNLKSQTEAVTQTLKDASSNSVTLGTALTQVMAAAANASSLQQLDVILDGVAQSGLTAAEGLGALYYAYIQVGNLQAAQAIQALKRVNGITLEQTGLIMAAVGKGFEAKINPATQGKDLAKAALDFLNDPKVWAKTNAGGVTKKYKELADAQVKSTKEQIKLLKAKKKIIDDEIKKEQTITDELKKQSEYTKKQQDLDEQILEAKIRGKYIEAASLLQEKQNNTVEFNKEKTISDLQAKSDAIQAQIDAIQAMSDDVVSAINEASADAAANAASIVAAIGSITFDTKQSGKNSSTAVPVDVSAASRKAYVEQNKPKIFPATGGEMPVTAEDLDPKVAWNDNKQWFDPSQVTGKTRDIFEKYIRSQIQTDLDRLDKDTDFIVVSTVGADGLTYKFKVVKNGEFIRMGKPEKLASGGYIKHFKPGGKVKGPGTSTSDSIPAMLSDGEYVIKASSVAKYGKETMDALNAGKYAKGGMVLPSFKKPSSPYNSKNQPTGSPYGRYWGELERLYQGSPIGFDKNGKPLFNNDGKDPWGGVEIPGLPFSGKVGQFSDYFHQLAEQPRKYSGPGMGLDKITPPLIGSGASAWSGGLLGGGGGNMLGYAEGGLASRPKYGTRKPKKQNWFQRYVSGLTKTSDSLPAWARDPLGAQALLRKIAGQSREGDNLSASMLPLNFMGMGAGRGLFLGMPRGIKALEEARTAEQTMKAIDASIKNGIFKDLPITQLGKQLEATVGKSFPVRGIGGLYEGADGTKEFVKPVTDSLSGLSEIRSNVISRKVGLTTPIQDLIKIMDPSDAKAKRTLLALRSAYNPEFANPSGEFTQGEYITQLVASLWRGDKDLQKANLSGKNLVDAGTSGVYDLASGMRKLSTSMPSMQDQAAINLLGVKGGAKRWFAETTAPIAQSMTPAEYHDAIIKEINRQIPLVEEAIASFNLTDPDEIQSYANLIGRLKSGAAPGVDWSPFQSMAASVVPAPVKRPSAAALAKKAEELELRKRQSGHAVGFSDLSFKERINGYHKGGPVGHRHGRNLPGSQVSGNSTVPQMSSYNPDSKKAIANNQATKKWYEENDYYKDYKGEWVKRGPSQFQKYTTAKNWKNLLNFTASSGPISDDVTSKYLTLMFGSNASKMNSTGKDFKKGEWVTGGLNLLTAGLTGTVSTAFGRAFIEQLGISKGIPGLGSLLPKGSLPFLGSSGSNFGKNALTAGLIGAGRPFLESHASTLISGTKSNKPALTSSTFAEQQKRQLKEVPYTKEIHTIGNLEYPVYKVGKSKEPISFQGRLEDTSATRGGGARVVDTTPEGLLKEAIRRNPQDEKLKKMYANFLNKKFGLEELYYMDRVAASVAYDDSLKTLEFENTDGFAQILASLTGDKSATKAIDEKTAQLYEMLGQKREADAAEFLAEQQKYGLMSSDIIPMDPTNAPIYHSTPYKVKRQPNGDVHLYPAGTSSYKNSYDPKTLEYTGVGRSTLHTSLESEVASHGDRLGNDTDIQVMSDLASVMKANPNRTINLDTVDAYIEAMPGQPVIFPNAQIIRRFRDKRKYVNELLKRGLIKKGDPIPSVIGDPKSNEVLRLVQSSYSDSDRSLFYDITNPEHAGTISQDLINKYTTGQEGYLSQASAEQIAKQQHGIYTPHTRQDKETLADSDLTQRYHKLAEMLGIPVMKHNGSSRSRFEQNILRDRGFSLYDGSRSKIDAESLASLRMAVLHGQFKTNVVKIQEPMTDAKGGYISNKDRKFVNYKLPSYEVGSAYIPEDQIAQLHKGERVLTAQENKNFSSSGPVTNNITINGADKDPKQIAQEVMLQLERMQSKNNKTNLVGR